jgi:flavin-dependent dehydrogenase
MSLEHLDVLIVGAGLSGIAAGYHLQADCPEKTYAVLEARDEGRKPPCLLHQNYAIDILALRFGAIEDGTLELPYAGSAIDAREQVA